MSYNLFYINTYMLLQCIDIWQLILIYRATFMHKSHEKVTVMNLYFQRFRNCFDDDVLSSFDTAGVLHLGMRHL